ncbi:polysialyltransferase family glycosyltransferase [Amphritea sp.]|uniref:polysialyltransferase family glycosyltransferase n=1 Tax=Amphritea sp. TaxID=1872502 RepID=UPI003A8E1BB2
MPCSVYFVSTLLHLFTATAIAGERKNETAVLVFIDQPEGATPQIVTLVQQWKLSPFAEQHLFFGRLKGGLSKLKKRRRLFHNLKALIERLAPDHLFVGNDRRIEFQYAMHIASSQGKTVTGHYMDEGTFTYVGREASSGVGDVIVDNLLKKMFYGLWWRNPVTVGASGWINEIHVAFPELIDSRLHAKEKHCLSAASFQADALQQLSQMMLQVNGVTKEQIHGLDVLITLPHESLFEKNTGYRDKILALIDGLEGSIAVKYHPRNSGEDALNLQPLGIKLLPSSISYEAILPLLSSDVTVVGDVSSTLLLTRWLRPEIKTVSYRNGTENKKFEQLFHDLNIEVL